MNSFAALKQSGWLHAVYVGAVGYPLWNLAARAGIVNYDINPIAFVSLALLMTSICLLLVARPGQLGSVTLKRPAQHPGRSR